MTKVASKGVGKGCGPPETAKSPKRAPRTGLQFSREGDYLWVEEPELSVQKVLSHFFRSKTWG